MKYLLLFICALLFSCASTKKLPPYACGPIMNQKDIVKTFQPLINYMELKSGDHFADVGASSGYFTVMMATLMTNNTIYIQDIDTTCLNNREVNKVIDYYSEQSKKQLRSLNTFHITLGSTTQTNLPDGAIDKIYSNGSFHCFSEPDQMVADLYTKLKPGGKLFIRDNFSTKKEIEYCVDKKCGFQLTKVDDFLAIMARNHFKVEKNQDFSGYPIYTFTKD